VSSPGLKVATPDACVISSQPGGRIDQGAEAAEEFLLDLHHAGIAFGLIVGEGHQHKDNEGAYHAVRKELIRICGPWAMACMTFQPWFFWGAVKMNGRWREFGCTVVIPI
jgi:hypothetical protein